MSTNLFILTIFLCVFFYMVTVLMPHLGTATLQTESDMADLAAKNVLNALNGETMVAPVYELP